ncbi:MAG TPA: D-alanyl-D-alanine carboxypeptidase family protein [Usitatibacter sp.]|nr:D-alanyl-D-alanine carboxypeptidase family protein [Usitatibacter sp.]
MKQILAALLALVALSSHAQLVTPPPIAARSYVLVDLLSGQTLAAGSENDRFEPASLTKLMTAWLAFDAIRAGQVEVNKAVTVSANAVKAPGARMFLTAGQTVQVGDLLRGMIVQSANDAAVALAEAVAGSESAFVTRMNAQATKMGLANTQFANATGQPAEGHLASARDLATLAAAVIRDFPEHYALYSQKEFAFNGINQSNRNRLLWTDPTVDGMKTGFTEAAAYCLVASARRGERRLVSVVMGAQSDTLRASETQKLLNFGFQAYETRRLYKKGDVIASPAIYKGTRPEAKLGFERDVWLTLPRDRFAGVRAVLETRQPFVAPLAAGQKAGIMKLTRDNAPVAEFPVVALEEVPLAGFLSRGWDSLKLMLIPTP